MALKNAYKFYFLYFIFGAACSLSVNFLGAIYLGELFSLIYLCFSFLNNRFDKKIININIVILMLLWGLSQIVSDIVNSTPLVNALKGSLTPFLMLFCLMGITQFVKNNSHYAPTIILGILTGTILNLNLDPTIYFEAFPWKFGYGEFFLGFFIVWCSFFSRPPSNKKLWGIILILLFVSLYYDSRGLALFPFVTLNFYLIYKNSVFSNKVKHLISSNSGYIVFLFFLVFGFLFIQHLFSIVLQSELLRYIISDQAFEKYSSQAKFTYGLLIGGRSEILISFNAFADNIIFGFGSWANDDYGYIDKLKNILSDSGYSDAQIQSIGLDQFNLIPAHSFLMGSAVWAGIFGFIFWMYMIFFLIRNFFENANHLNFYFYYGVLTLLWNILFSPLGAPTRWSTVVFLGFYISYTYMCKSLNKC